MPTLAQANEAKALVVQAITELMIERDLTAIDRSWSEDYIQRNPMALSGREPLRGLIANAPEGAIYEMGMRFFTPFSIWLISGQWNAF